MRNRAPNPSNQLTQRWVWVGHSRAEPRPTGGHQLSLGAADLKDVGCLFSPVSHQLLGSPEGQGIRSCLAAAAPFLSAWVG